MCETYITQAKILSYCVKGKFVIVDFLLSNGVRGQVVRTGSIAKTRYKVLKKMVGQQIQVKAYCDSYCDSLGILAIPTFFDSKQRCKECGRFYKLYCKHCYERFKNLGVVMDRFEEDYVKGIKDYTKGLKNE